MKNWQETTILFKEIVRLLSEGRNGALAMIVGLEGSAYRSPGAKLLVRDDGSMIGNVSGGCLESDVMENGLAAIKSRKSKLLHYDTGGGEDKIWGLGVGCGGKVDVLVIPFSTPGFGVAVESVRAYLRGDDTFCISTVVSGAPDVGRMTVANAEQNKGSTQEGVRIFTEVLEPPPRLIVCGAGDNARPVIRLSAEAGFRVTVVDHRSAYLTESRFPDAVSLVAGRAEDAVFDFEVGRETLAVVMFHILVHDKAWVSRFAEKGVKYIGLLGSRSRRGDIMAGLSEEQKARVYGPVGLDIGAVGPEQVAISIVSEVLAVFSGRKPQHLRDRNRGIHEN